MIKNFTKFSYFVLGIFFTLILSLSFTTFAQIKPIEEQVATTTSKYITATTTIYTIASQLDILTQKLNYCESNLINQPNKYSTFKKWYMFWKNKI